jgi:hypothetical protein
MPVADRLNLDLAWRRLKQDRPDRVFVTHPFLIEIVESALDEWLDTVRRQLHSKYSPHDCVICYAPKPNWLVRPGAVLSLEDELLFNAILGQLHENLWTQLKWSQGNPDIGYRLSPPSKTPLWVRNDFSIWAEWRTKSLAALDDGVFFVLTTDITGFYENIDLQRLSSDLKTLTDDHELLTLLMELLNRWAVPRGKGIPQGYSASDILAKVYLDPVDRGMKNAGFVHLRYVDDIRVFCKTSLEAKRALFTLNDLVRKRGLNLQSAKTEIIRASDARVEIDGVTPLIQSISQQLGKELQDLTGGASPYGSLKDIELFHEQYPLNDPPEILERAFSENFIASGDNFDKTLFHFLLTRLGKVGSRHAVDYCLRSLPLHPEETKYILRYLSYFRLEGEIEDRLLDCLHSVDSIFDYQLYEIVRWFYARGAHPERLLTVCRAWILDKNRSTWLRAYCLAILGEVADVSDLDSIEGLYASVSTDIDRIVILGSLSRMEVGRRNALMGRVKGDSFLVQRSVEYVRRQGHSPPPRTGRED